MQLCDAEESPALQIITLFFGFIPHFTGIFGDINELMREQRGLLCAE
jgi:hypothetical protein